MATAVRPHLSAGYVALAIRLQDSVGDLSAPEARQKLIEALMDEQKCPIGAHEAGARHSASDMQLLQTIHDHAVGLGASCGTEEMSEAYRERDISDKEREAMDSEDFAGKGKSFPIKTQADVDAAFHSIGRAGADNYSHDKIRANIIRIAKRKGLTLPKSAQESATLVRDHEMIKLTEGAATTEAIVLREARADYEIKLIAPGKGSSAFYPAEVLKRDGPQVFRAGTHVYLNHPTAAEEAARPEGDVANLAGVLTTDATYHESHAKGPGLYGRMKVFADHATMVEEKAPHVGMSIRASGDAVVEGKRPVMRDGVPVLARLTSAESVDVVTRAGAGGMILTEAARSAESHQEVSVDQTALEKLQQQIALQEAANKRLLERALRADAREEAARLLETVSLPAQAKLKIIETCVRDVPVTAEGALDTAKFKESIDAETKSMGAFLSSIGGGGHVRGLGDSGPVETDPAKLREAQERQAADEKLALAEAEGVFARLMGDKTAAKNAALKGVAA